MGDVMLWYGFSLLELIREYYPISVCDAQGTPSLNNYSNHCYAMKTIEYSIITIFIKFEAQLSPHLDLNIFMVMSLWDEPSLPTTYLVQGR